ncbi:MAG TPA: Tic20 family protein [Candidatus Caenarcaniphilales bacterium]
MKWRGSTSLQERVFACLPYLLPLLDGLAFGRFLFRLFPPLELILIPLAPLLLIYSFPLASLIIFFALFLLVVRNENISHFIRFNTMQAILVDIVLFLFQLILRILASVVSAGFLLETFSNFVFIGVVAVFVYSVVQSLRGRYAEIPTLSEAVYMQVR